VNGAAKIEASLGDGVTQTIWSGVIRRGVKRFTSKNKAVKGQRNGAKVDRERKDSNQLSIPGKRIYKGMGTAGPRRGGKKPKTPGVGAAHQGL